MRKMSHGVPDLYKPEGLANCFTYNRNTVYMARPIGYQGLRLFRRLQLAWGVFTGRYDALEWDDVVNPDPSLLRDAVEALRELATCVTPWEMRQVQRTARKLVKSYDALSAPKGDSQ